MAVDVGSAVGYLDLDINKFVAGLKTAQSEADKYSKEITRDLSSNFKSIGTSLTSVGKSLTKGLTVPLAGVATAGLKVASDFEASMLSVKAISGATGDEFNALREKAIQLGADTAYSSNEVAQAMTEMAKAGWNSTQIIDGMQGVLDAASASGEDLAIVSTIVADAITGFGLSASDSTHVADLLTQAANSGTIGINDLGETFKYISPVANAMGLSIEDVTTAVTAMSQAGIKGSQAGTSLRTMLTRMVKPTDAVKTAMDELGIVLTNSDGSFKSLDTILAEMRTKFSGLTDDQKTYYAAVLSGQEGMSGLLSLMNLTQEEYDEIAASMDNCNGIAEETAAIMRDNLKSDVEQLGGALESLAIKIGDLTIPTLRKFVQWLTNLIEKFLEMPESTQKIILAIAGIAVGIGPVLWALGKLSTAFGNLLLIPAKMKGFAKTLTATFGQVGDAMANFAMKIGLVNKAAPTLNGSMTGIGAAFKAINLPMLGVVAGIGILIAAFVNLWKTNEEFKNNILAIWDTVKQAFSEFGQGIVEALNSLGFEFESFTEVVSSLWNTFCNLLAPVFEGAFTMISGFLQAALDVILGIVQVFSGLFSGDWSLLWEGVKNVFFSIWDAIKGFFGGIITAILGIAQEVITWFGTTWTELWNNVKSFFEGIWNSLKSFFANVWNNLKNTVSNAMNSVKNTISSVLNVIKSTWENIWNGIKTFFSNIWNSIKTTVSNVINNIKSFISNGVNNIKSIWTNAWNSVKNTLTNAWNSIKNGVSNGINSVVNFVKGLPSKILKALGNVGSLLYNAGKSIINGLLNGIKNACSKVWNFVSGIGSKIASLKGPEEYDKKLLIPAGGWIMEGLGNGLAKGFTDVEDQVSKMGGQIADSFDAEDLNVGVDLTENATTTQTTLTNALKTAYNDIATYFETIEQRLKKSVDNMAQYLSTLFAYGVALNDSNSDIGYISYNGFTSSTRKNRGFEGYTDNSPDSKGDTFIFNSPKAIDEVEAARQMKRAKRELAEGFI